MKSFSKTTVFSRAAIASLFGAATLPAMAVDKASDQTSRMDTVVVTATRTAVSVDESVSTVKVLDRQDIERSQARSVPGLLQSMAGMHFTNNGGRGKSSSLFLRGTNSDHVVVLIDGVKVGSATLGSVPFQDLPIDQIERIEVVRGARSSLYGSEAIGGVIQIFTRKGGGDTRVQASVTAGSQDTFEGSLGVSGGQDNLFYNASATGSTTSGYDSCRAEAAGTGGCFNDEPDNDGYENFSGNLRLGVGFEGGSEVAVVAMQTQGKNEFDGNFQNSSDTTQRVLGVNSSIVVSDNYFAKLSAGRSLDTNKNYLDEVYVTNFDTIRDTLSLQNDLSLGQSSVLSFGADYQRDEVDSTTAYPVNERENLGGFAQFQWGAGPLNLELSGRHDDNEQYGSQKTFGTGLGYKLNDSVRLVVSHGTAFKAPTFNQLYFPFFGSPDLKPEESTTSEIGVRGQLSDQRWAVTFFKTDIDDLIVYDGSLFAANNLDRAKIQGIELEYDRQINQQWSAALDLTLMNPEDASDNANNGNLLPRRPKRSGRLNVRYAAEDWSAQATLNVVGTRYDNIANTRELSAYRTLDLGFEKELADAWLMQLHLENVTDTDYETASFYVQQERSVFVTLRYQP